jgi:hypothetical protein
MLMVPIFEPVPVAMGAVVAEAAGELAGPEGAAALLVWAKAEIIEKTAIARRERTSLLVIGSLKLLGTYSAKHVFAE